jgi:hypothetical protein
MPCPHCNGTVKHNGKGCPLRKRSGRRLPRRILAWDCETVDGRIVLFLAAGSDREPIYLYDPGGLQTEQVFGFLVERGARRLNIGFFFDYDVNQLLRGLPALHLDQLRARGSVTWRGWRIRHVPGKRFSLARLRDGRSMTIWDVSGWVQCSFLQLCEDWKLGSGADRAYVALMKGRRDDLSAESEASLVRYTTLECALLCDWFRQCLELHQRNGIKLQSYSGAGSTAAALLRRHGFRPPTVPASVQEVAEQSFFGGRSETSVIGPVPGTLFQYDINSAYPAAIAALPDVRDARWFRTSTWSPDLYGFWKVRWQQPRHACWGLFPVRGARLPTGRRSVSLLYPIEGEGWYHTWEVAAALEVAPRFVEVLEGWVCEPRQRPAFPWVPELAARRLALKQAGSPDAFVLKVGLNSLYGKLAQHTGSAPMQSIVYAAAITAHTRAQMLRLLVPYQHQILLVATDGIVARCPLPVECGAALGQWEPSEHRDAFVLQAGVYWLGSKVRSRGIDGRQITLAAAQQAWAQHGPSAMLEVTTRRVLSYRIACARGRPDLTGAWEVSQRAVSFSPAPRRREWRYDGAALLTLPARVRDYRRQALVDALLIDELDDGADDALPDWCYE